jgi:citrate lyase subunit beta/citryl-CoA lyase
MANVEAIAQSSRRLEAMHFGVADFAASVRARTVSIGGLNPDYPGDQWHCGARAHDGGVPGVRTARHRRAVRRLQGRRWLHARPRVAMRPSGSRGNGPSIRRRSHCANQVFSPPPAEVDRAKRILVALDEAARDGKGAAQLDGRMIDAASARMAQVVVEIAEAVAKRSR